jgi:hypothetical protein
MCIRKVIAVCLVLLFTAAVLTGCLGVKSPPVSRPTPPAIFVEYHRTGGIAGLDDRLVVFDNGVAVISGKTISREIFLNQTDLERITRIFNEAQFSKLQGNFTARPGGADYFRYTISYHGKTVITEDSAIPPSLQPVIDELERIIRSGIADEQQKARPFTDLP